MSDAPYCNVDVATPAGDPKSPHGSSRVPPNATLAQLINIINNNFALLSKGNFVEDRTKRVTVVERIYDSAGGGAYMDFAVIKTLHLTNPLTGQTVVWKR